MHILTFHRIAHRLYRLNIPLLPKIIQIIEFLLFNSYLPYQVVIGKGSRMGHRGIAVVINKKCTIGENCLIRPHVTIGDGGAKIGNHVEIGDGAKILGNVTIGDHAKIGANAVVLEDVPPHCTAVGVPARIIKRNG